MSYIYLLSFVFVVIFTTAQGASSCDSVQCGASDRCCSDVNNGALCYDPSSYDCVNGDKLCGKGEGVCAGSCYDATQYTCTEDGQLVQGTPSSNPLFCGSFNINPCQEGQSCCENDCYDPNNFVCLNYTLCPVGNSICGDGYGDLTCYAASTTECCNGRQYPIGASPCSESSATCCSCSCDAATDSSSAYTVLEGQCTNQYVTSQFGELSCPSSISGDCSPGPDGTCNTTCGQYQFYEYHCGVIPQLGTGCVGDYICAGGSYTCSTAYNGECQVPVISTSFSTTQYTDGTTPYEAIPAGYTGEVCCWCASVTLPLATSSPVPSVANCTLEYLEAFEGQSYPGAECRVWSTFTPYTPAGPNTACGLPFP